VYVTPDGEEICALTMGDTGRSSDWPIQNFVQGLDGTVFIRSNFGLMLQVFPYGSDDTSSIKGDDVPLCHFEKYDAIGGGLEVLAVTEEGVVAYEPDTKSIFQIPKGEGRSTNEPINPAFRIASGFGNVQQDSAVVLEDGETMPVWDFNNGLYKVSLKPNGGKVRLNVAELNGYHDVFHARLDPNDSEMLLFYKDQNRSLNGLNLLTLKTTPLYDSVSCIFHPTNFIEILGGIKGIDESTNTLYDLIFESDEVKIIQPPSNTTALHVMNDGTIVSGYSGCNSEPGHLELIHPDGELSIIPGMQDYIRKVKTSGDKIFVLGVRDFEDYMPDRLTSDVDVFEMRDHSLQHLYSVNLGDIVFGNISILNTGNGLACDQWRRGGRCVEFGPEGIVRPYFCANAAHFYSLVQTQAISIQI